MSPDADPDQNSARSDDDPPEGGRVGQLVGSANDWLRGLGTRIGSTVDDRRDARSRARLLRQLGEITVSHHAAGGGDYSAEMLALIDEIAALDPAAAGGSATDNASS